MKGNKGWSSGASHAHAANEMKQKNSMERVYSSFVHTHNVIKIIYIARRREMGYDN
jgi:hypothetical protein